MDEPATIAQTRAPIPVRLLNRCGAALQKIGLGAKALTRDDVIEQAKRRCQLEDFGGDELFEPLGRLLESAQSEAHLNLVGRIALRCDVVRTLCNRLWMERDRILHPEIAAQEIRQPLFIVGLPRSGTTLLHTLLAADPDHRVPLTWEVMSPSPPTSENEASRIRQARRDVASLRWLAPTFERVHAIGVELPQECVSLMSPSFMSDQFDTMYNVPSYRAWFFQQDLRPSYEYHRRFLQQLQRRKSGRRWILKAPAHMFAPRSLLSTYPDARFVQTHRDPLAAIASVSSLITILRRIFSDVVDPIQVGYDAIDYWSKAVAVFMRERARLTPDRICDLQYDDIRQDPIAATRRIYEHFGWNLSPDVEQRMRLVLTQQAHGRNGTHRYDPSHFGLDRMNGFAAYCERFGFTTQSSGEPAECAQAAA
jgi:Sulfotransferase family